jgi:lysyl-tRNA synthetase, class I
MNKRFDITKRKAGESWVKSVVDQLILDNPNKAVFTAAAGISPSGVVHFGNFRDVFTTYMVVEELKSRGKQARLIFSWDNFDRFRKVPVGLPENFTQYIGMPLSKVPDPFGIESSYAAHFQKPFVEAIQKLQIDIEYKDQTALYEAGTYDDQIQLALEKRLEIADILISFMSDKAIAEKQIDIAAYREEFYPIAIYSRFTGKDSTRILSYNGDMSVTYVCLETKKQETVDLREHHIASLKWKIDWPMRWQYEGVDFEPGGADHAAPGGSYDVASTVIEKIFGGIAPTFVEYLFVGIRGNGAKMSGSKGNAVSPLDLLDIYDPDMLTWLYKRKDPNQSFELAFDSEIYRQYDEYDTEKGLQALSFRQTVGLGQITQWDIVALQNLLTELGQEVDMDIVKRRLPLAKNWVHKYNTAEAIALNTEVNQDYVAALSAEQKNNITSLRNALVANSEAHIADLDIIVYGIVKREGIEEKELKQIQRAFFVDIYNLLINKDTGPRLGTFLWAVDRTQVLKLLDIA